MMIRVRGQYLDFNGDIEVESRVKLFESIDKANGNFSYTIELINSGHNLAALGYPVIDSIKSIYNDVPCEIVDDSGLTVYRGSLQLNKITKRLITATFHSGNTEWFGLLSNNLNQLSLAEYDIDLTYANIEASWSATSGLVFPIIDNGLLVNRTSNNLKVEDFKGCFYVKTLFKEIFQPIGIKIDGDLINDPLYNSLIVLASSGQGDTILERTSFIGKSGTQTIGTSDTLVTFTDDTTKPYFDGALNNYASNRYTADIKMSVSVTILLEGVSGVTGNGILFYFVNGVNIEGVGTGWSLRNGDNIRTKYIILEAGDYLDIYAYGLSSYDITGGYIKITPIYLYKTFGQTSVPNWSQGDFVSNIIKLFNVVPYYESETKVLTLNIFDRIKSKPEINISEGSTLIEADYSVFISNYAKKNTFKYNDGSDEDLRDYSITEFVSYGSGEITVDNDFVKNEQTIIESDFTSPITYLSEAFGASLERAVFFESEVITQRSITSVSNASGVPRFNIGTADIYYTVGNLVLLDTNDDLYNGEYIISDVTSTYITVNGLVYTDNATGTAQILNHKLIDNDDVYLLQNVVDVSPSYFSSEGSIIVDNTTVTSIAFAFFNLLSNGTDINDTYKQGLSFGGVDNPLNYQLTLLDTYWSLFAGILSDPVLITLDSYRNYATFKEMQKFGSPMRFADENTNNQYYLNNMAGYRNSYTPCELKLIKLP